MRKRMLVLPIAAILIALLCIYRLSKDAPNAPPPLAPKVNHRPAPVFVLLDTNNEKVRLDTYLGRHKILLAFFDGVAGVDRDPIVDRLRRDIESVRATDTKVFAISTAIPQVNRKIIERVGPYPFPLLSDPRREVLDQWGVGPDDKDQPVSLLFFVDRASNVDYGSKSPQPVDNPQQFLDELLSGKSTKY